MTSFKELSDLIRACKLCPLHCTRTNVVVGKASKDIKKNNDSPAPDIVFIGEAPGEEEDKQGKPFVGKSGQLLDEAIKHNHIGNYAVINIIKCRPPENRKPNQIEIEACKPWLDQQLETLNPKLIVLLGATSLNYFFPDEKITACNGKTLMKDDQRYLIFFHPSYVLRGAYSKENYLKDFDRVRFFLGDGEVEEKKKEEPLIPKEPFKPFVEDAFQKVVPTPILNPPPELIGPTPPEKDFYSQKQRYVPLHCHSEYGSIGDVFRTNDEWADDLAQKGFEACAITDHGSLSGLYYFQEAMKKKGIKPILGIECYIKELDKESHLTLLIKNEIGYKNLLTLHNIAKEGTNPRKGGWGKTYQRIPISEVLRHHEGLICATACISGFFARKWRRNEDVEVPLLKLKETFGDDFYIEVMPHAFDEQRRYNEYIMKLAKKHGVKLIITTDSHYNNKSDKHYHDCIKAIVKHQSIQAPKVGFDGDTFCNLTTEELSNSLKLHPLLYPIREEMYRNTIEISNKCNFELPSNLGDTLIGNESEAREKILNSMNIEEYKLKSGHNSEIIDQRIKLELDLIFNRGFSKYFVSILDMIQFAKDNNIPVGPGRGSVGGSLVAYLLGITKVDPLRFGTLFERFLSPTRTPDIDMDFSGKNREAMIGYIKSKYGGTNTSYIITFAEFGDKLVIRDVGRIYGLPLDEINKATKELTTKTAESLEIEKAMESSKDFKHFAELHPDVIDACLKIRGKIRHIGVHAAGIVICNNLSTTIPTEIYKDSRVCSWEKDALEKLGIVKFDVLGLNALDIINETLKLSKIGWDKLPENYDDPRVFELLRSGLTAGVFQFGSKIVTDYLKKLKPNSFSDLAATNALCRPGPLNSGMSFDYIKRKNGENWRYEHPLLESVTKDTFGIICYQEQIMQIAHVMGNFSMVDSEKFMKAIAKSEGKEALKEKYDEFLSGALKNGVSKEVTDSLFDKILEFGRYGFNYSHSVEYSIIGYWLAWLKVHYPLQTYTALINSDESEEEILRAMKEAMNQGIKIKPPSISKISPVSTVDVNENTIYLGLNKIKGLGEKEISAILNTSGGFLEVKKAIKKNTFEILVLCGFFDSIDNNRKRFHATHEPVKSTLFHWSDKSEDTPDWSDQEKIEKMRKYLSWPRSEDELPETKYDDKISPLSVILQEEDIENRAILVKGWVYETKQYDNKFGTSYVLKFEDGTSRAELSLYNSVYSNHEGLVKSMLLKHRTEPLFVCIHPYFLKHGEITTRNGKAQILWMGEVFEKVPENILNGIGQEIELGSENQYLITNLVSGISKKGNHYSILDTINFAGEHIRGTMMTKGYVPKLGEIITGKWDMSSKGTYWRWEGK